MTEKNSLRAEKNAYLANQPIGKLLLRFSVPCVLSMLVSALYNIVDQIFIGQSVGYLGNAATNVVYPFTVVALAAALLIGDGCAALLSLSLGSGNHENSHRCVGNGITLTIFASVVLTALGFFFIDPILGAFGATPANYPYAREYMEVILIGIPFYMFTSGMNSPIRADGAPRYAMVATVLGAVLNLILDPVAIFVFHLGVRGAAIATVIGQVVSCLMTALYFRRPRSFRLQRSSFRINGRLSKKIVQLGISSFITQVAIVVIIGVSNNMIVQYGPMSPYGADIPLSVVGIVMKVFGIVIAFSVGIAVGGQPIAGYNYGAQNYGRVFTTYRLVLIANLVVGAVAMLLFELCPQAIIRIFGSENGLYNEYAELCFRVFLGGILLCCVQKASSIFLQSIGKPVKSTVLSLSRDVLFLVPGILLLSSCAGVTGMLWAAPIADILAFVLAIILIAVEYRAIKRKQARQIAEDTRPGTLNEKLQISRGKNTAGPEGIY